MVIPTKTDIIKREKKHESFLKHLDEDGRMQESKLCTQIRSAVRNVWLKHPTKLAYLYEKTYPDMNPNSRTKWLIDCECCGNAFKLNDVQVDHLNGENSLKSFEDILPFANSILGVRFEDIQVLCIPCHEVRTYAQRFSMSFEEAAKEKEVITKLKQPVTTQKKELLKAGFTEDDISNNDKRRECYRKLLTGEKND